jgi:hypothetical protein
LALAPRFSRVERPVAQVGQLHLLVDKQRPDLLEGGQGLVVAAVAALEGVEDSAIAL